MNKTQRTRFVSFLLCAVLIAAMALCTMGCNAQQPETPADDTTVTTTAAKITFTFEVTDGAGETKSFTVTTDKKTVGDALLAEGLIAGEEGAYGLYVKTVNGITADYDVDGTYWAFYVNGAYASSGVDTTDAVDGATYAFKVEK